MVYGCSEDADESFGSGKRNQCLDDWTKEMTDGQYLGQCCPIGRFGALECVTVRKKNGYSDESNISVSLD